MPKVAIGNRLVGDGRPPFLIAEIGQNHQGDARIANNLWKSAYEAGFDAVKFQKRDLDHEYTADFGNQPYNSKHSFGATYAKHRKALEFTCGDLAFIQRRAIEFNEWHMPMIVTPCHPSTVDELVASVDIAAFKIASRDIDNGPLLLEVAQAGLPVIVSTGMATYSEVEQALRLLEPCDVILLHCTSNYPTEPAEAQLMNIPQLASTFGRPVGWSDHTTGVALAPAAVALGACMFEKHITFNRAAKGSDHAGSLEPTGQRAYVTHIEAAYAATSPEIQIPHHSTVPAQRKLRRSLVLNKPIEKGHAVTEDDLDYLSPGMGLGWHERLEVIGRVAKRSLPRDHAITGQDVEVVSEPVS